VYAPNQTPGSVKVVGDTAVAVVNVVQSAATALPMVTLTNGVTGCPVRRFLQRSRVMRVTRLFFYDFCGRQHNSNGHLIYTPRL
jgi:hypothetical protein